MHAAKIQAYVKKIKQFQKIKKQRWDPDVEQELAQDLVMVDNLMMKTSEEKDIEQKLRTGNVPGMNIELSLRRQEEHKMNEARREKAETEAKLKEVREKKHNRLRMAREERAIQRQIRKYEVIAVPKELKGKHIQAKLAYTKARKMEEMAKKSKHYREFAKEYRLNTPAEKNADYPKTSQAVTQAPSGQAPKGQPPAALGETAGIHNTEDRIIVKQLPQRNAVSFGHVNDAQAAVDLDLDDDQSANESADKVRSLDSSLSTAALASIKSVNQLLNHPSDE